MQSNMNPDKSDVVERPAVEEFLELCSNPDSPWGMADIDAVDLCKYALCLEARCAESASTILSLREALKPFADLAPALEDKFDHVSQRPDDAQELHILVVGDLRRALSAYRGKT